MKPLLKLIVVEFKLILRDPVSLFFVLALPIGFLLLFGLNSNGSKVDAYLPSLMVALSLGMTGLFTLPTYLASYREKGILRRMSTTPVPPIQLLITQLVINIFLALVGLVLLMLLGNYVLGVVLPVNIIGFAIAFFLGVSAQFSLGLIVAAVASNGRMASAIGSLLLYPSLFFAGIWIPRSSMPAPLARIGEYTPLGATQDLLFHTWVGEMPNLLQLGAMAIVTIVLSVFAARMFRWQ